MQMFLVPSLSSQFSRLEAFTMESSCRQVSSMLCVPHTEKSRGLRSLMQTAQSKFPLLEVLQLILLLAWIGGGICLGAYVWTYLAAKLKRDTEDIQVARNETPPQVRCFPVLQVHLI